MFEFFHISGFGHPYKLRNIVLNLKIFDRKFDRGLVGYRPGPQTVIGNEKKELKFHLQLMAFVLWNALCDAIRRDFSKK